MIASVPGMTTDNASPNSGAGSIILVGAGEDDLAWRDRALRVVLVQPEAELAGRLAAAARDLTGVSVHPVALGRSAGEAVLRVMNFADLTALRPMTDRLRALLPGLREIARQDVTRITVAGLLEQAGALPDPLRLGITAPGEEAEILQALAEAGLLERLASLRLRCGEEIFHDGAEARPALLARMEAAGFVLQRSDHSDPDWPVLEFWPDRVGRALTGAQARVAELEAELTDAAQQRQALQDRYKELSGEADWRHKRIAELETAAVDAATAAAATLNGVKTEMAGQAAALADAAQQQQALQDRYKDLAEKADWRQKRIAALEAAAGKAQADLTGAQARIAELEAAAAARTAALHAAEAEVTGHAAALTEAAQQQALQDRYKDLAEKADRRHKRIAELEAAAGKMQEELTGVRKAAETARKDNDRLISRLGQARDDLRRAEGQIGLIKELLLGGERL